METENFRLFAANGNGKQDFVFLGKQTKNGNRRCFSKRAYLRFYLRYRIQRQVDAS
jgi:hypothetical protein